MRTRNSRQILLYGIRNWWRYSICLFFFFVGTPGSLSNCFFYLISCCTRYQTSFFFSCLIFSYPSFLSHPFLYFVHYPSLSYLVSSCLGLSCRFCLKFLSSVTASALRDSWFAPTLASARTATILPSTAWKDGPLCESCSAEAPTPSTPNLRQRCVLFAWYDMVYVTAALS